MLVIIKLKTLLKEITTEQKSTSWLDPYGNFKYVEFSHGSTAVRLAGTVDDPMMILWKKGWQRVTYYTRDALYCNNAVMLPNDIQKRKLIELTQELDFPELRYDDDSGEGYKILWSKNDVLQENHATGDWMGWEDCTSDDREQLKIVLRSYQNYVGKIYTHYLADPKIQLVQKTIDNLDVSDPRFSAKPLALLDMEDRIFIGDFVDKYGNEGTSKVMNFLFSISRKYIKPINHPKPEIELKDVLEIVSPRGKFKGDVYVTGLEDMKPTINFGGYGNYCLTNDFIKKFSRPNSQLYLDFGQDIKVVNMSEVMEKVKKEIDRLGYSL